MKKILISLSSPELVAVEYTGKSGLYSAVTPNAESLRVITKLANDLGFTPDENTFHVTLMYSKESQPKVGAVGCNPNRIYKANIVGVQHWDGHDDKGYLSLKLVSPELAVEHMRLKEAGCTPTFSPYEPHITVWAGVKLTDELQAKITKVFPEGISVPILLSKQFIGDVKP